MLHNKILNKNKKGFSLVEMLLVIGILLIVSAVAMSAAGKWKDSIKMKEYDDISRQIYLVAQNKLTTLKAVGTLDTFLEKAEAEYPSHKLGTLDKKPQDYTEETEDWKNIYYFTSSDPLFVEYIIGKDSALRASLNLGAEFIVELNPKTGDVYSVFYSEKAFTYYDVAEFSSRERDVRKEKMIGYYGGASKFSAGSNLPTEFTPVVTVVNKEDLYLDIECSGMKKFIKEQSKVALSVAVTDESFSPTSPTSHTYTIDLIGGTDFWISNDTIKVQVLLDSVRGGNETFENITKGNLTLGDDITVTVSLTYANEGVTITGSSVAPVTNSFFASKDEDDNLSVGYVRHLNNLKNISLKNNIIISQTGSIDYDYDNWDEDVLISEKASTVPYTESYEPISINTITYNGNDNELLNFDISGGDNSGFFATATSSTLMNMKLVDFSISGGSAVGSLAGQVKGGSITNCGVYLSTRDEYGRPLTDMQSRVSRYKVVGISNVGGLVGQIDSNTVVKDSFAAIDVVSVSGGLYVGGFCGQDVGGSFANCYSSGDVTATGHFVGGFAGSMVDASADNCYSTSDVNASAITAFVGGFVGSAANGTVKNSNSYGLVQSSTSDLDIANCGGFVGQPTNITFTNCKYLSQVDYNDIYTKTVSGVLPKTYVELKVSGNLQSNSYPYSDALVGNTMPFTMLKSQEGAVISHYGDWFGGLKLQTSLVYYEKYATADANGSYFGYYAETSLTSVTGEESEEEEVNVWRVNTLRQQACVEDGYALLSVNPLSKFTYRSNDDLNSSVATQTVEIAESESETTKQKATKIAENTSLSFTNTTDNSRYSIANAMVYRLPFSLQMTDRNTAARFYDRLKITGYYDTEIMFEDYIFFYCPDFAKNAINPKVSIAVVATPADPGGEDSPIFVRSPRHLNALARAGYYWNTTKWADSKSTKYYFVQENTVDFGAYTKKYCGETYDLMDTSSSNTYRNRPIGRPNNKVYTDANGNQYSPSNFKHSYDGQGYEIIDFRCRMYAADDYQFVGLFGEIEGAQLQNIVMVASDPENDSGYVISEYNSVLLEPTGVGALVGLTYVGTDGNYADNATYSYASIINCSVSGYTVKYAPTNTRTATSMIGGLVGVNFGKIDNCSAVNKLVTEEVTGSSRRMVGGLVGSINGAGTITNSYTGGVVKASRSTGTVSIAGVCAGFENIWGAYWLTNTAKRNMAITNVYSYCEWETENAPVKPYPLIYKQDKITLTNGYYLTDVVGSGVTMNTLNGAVGVDFLGLSRVSFGASGTAQASGEASVANTHPWLSSLQSLPYSFPAVVTNPREAAVTYVHYGDWYYEMLAKKTGYLVYYETYSDGTYMFNYMNDEDTLVYSGAYDSTNSKSIAKAGYGVLRLSTDTGEVKVDGTQLKVDSVLESDVFVENGTYDLYSLSDESVELLMPESGDVSKEIEFAYEIVTDVDRTSAVQTFYVNAAFADTFSMKALEANSHEPLKIRTAEQLQNMSTHASKGWYMKLDHDIIADENTGDIVNGGYHFVGGYLKGGTAKTYNGYKTGNNGMRIFGLTKPLFSSIDKDGSVSELGLIGVDIDTTTEGVAALAKINNGTIQNCFATGTIDAQTTSYGSAGFVWENNGTINTSYANISITNINGDVAGFALKNTGTIADCYNVGKLISQNADASGFVSETETGSQIQKCYTVATVSGIKSYGFTIPSSTGINSTTCYYPTGSGNSGSAGTSKTRTQIRTIFYNGSWTSTNSVSTTWSNTMTGYYLYPRIAILDHHGDWPTL